jgi:hypothetical protein
MESIGPLMTTAFRNSPWSPLCVCSGQSRPFDDVQLMSALPPFERWRPARFTLFLKLNARFSLPMSSIALNSRDGKDHRLSRHRHHCRVRIRLLAIGTDEA